MPPQVCFIYMDNNNNRKNNNNGNDENDSEHCGNVWQKWKYEKDIQIILSQKG